MCWTGQAPPAALTQASGEKTHGRRREAERVKTRTQAVEVEHARGGAADDDASSSIPLPAYSTSTAYSTFSRDVRLECARAVDAECVARLMAAVGDARDAQLQTALATRLGSDSKTR
jgi:hypothetical protein